MRQSSHGRFRSGPGPHSKLRVPRRAELRRGLKDFMHRGTAALMVLALVLGQALSLAAPVAAMAAPSTVSFQGYANASGENEGFSVFRFSDSSYGVCTEPKVTDPQPGDVFTNPVPVTQASASQLAGVDPYTYAYFAAYAPLGGSYNDYGFVGSEGERGAATLVANVILQGGYVDPEGYLHWSDDSYYGGAKGASVYDSKSGNDVRDAAELAKIERLVADARAHAGQSGWWDGSATYWQNSTSDARQNVITFNHVEKYGGISLVKSSSNPSVSEGSDCYSLAGAVYGVYSDKACTSEVGRMTTAEDGTASIGNLPVATYYVREITAPEGFAKDEATHEVQVSGGVNATLRVSDTPLSDPVNFVVQKVDAQGNASNGWDAQGNATVEGAQFTVRFYEGYYDSADELPSSADRTWVIETRLRAGKVRAILGEDWLVSGDSFYGVTGDGRALLPLGTFTVQETKAPEGYNLTDGSVHVGQVVADASKPTGTRIDKIGSWSSTFDQEDAGAGLAVVDQVKTGGIAVPKIDHELKEGVAQGDATLEGAVIGIYNASDNAIVYEGRQVQPGQQVTTIRTDAQGKATTGAHDLPYGNYSLKEVAPPEGYQLNTSWNPTVSVQKDGVIVTAETLEDPVITGSGAVTKVDAETLASAPQGDATLKDAEITIWNRSEGPVVVGGVTYQPGDVVAKIHTNEVGDATSASLPYGTYEARETGASEGYLLNEDWSQTFEVRDNGQVVKLENLPEPIVRGGVEIRKVDADTLESAPQGDATLAGAEFTVTNRSKSAVYVGGKRYEVGEVVATLVTDEKGEAFTDQYALPYGTYEIRESKPSEGYKLPDGWARTIQVRAHGEVHDLTTDDNVAPEPVIRGGVAVSKLDRELLADRYGIDLDKATVDELGEPDAGSDVEDAGLPLGGATLEGAQIEITNRSDGPVVVNGATYQPGEVVYTMTTDESGEAATPTDLLPYGTYELTESVPSEGYLVNESWSLSFSVREDGKLYDFREDEDSSLDEQVIRGDFSLSKHEEGSQQRMAGVPFKVTSRTTGEWHIVVTDENGMVDTSNEWNAHSRNTNASDAALLADGTVDESKLDATAGVWFTGRNEAETDPFDAAGALPYDTYDIEELRCAANEGHHLVSTTVTISRDGFNLDLGTFDDREVSIATTLSYGDGSSRSVPAAEGVTLTDEVRFEGLEAGKTYRLEGEIHAIDAEGNDQGVVATATEELTPNFGSGSKKVAFELDTFALQGMTLVCFERLYDGTELAAEHADPTDEYQTLWVPAVTTTLLSDTTSDHDGPSWADSAVTDSVTLANLVPGESYAVTGELHVRASDGTDAGALKGNDGEPVTATAEFKATGETMVVQLPYEVPSSRLAGVTLVGFATLSNSQGDLASHADISDEGQSVRYPLVATEAISEATGDHQATQDSQTVTDTVSLRNLIVGREYTVTGELHLKNPDGTDAGAMSDASGDAITSSKTFTAEDEDMELELSFEVDASELGDRDIVAYETLTRDGMLLARHADITDSDQTVHVPELGTTATSEATGDHNVPAYDKQVVVDEVRATNLIVGKEYTVSGTLHVKGLDESGTVIDKGALTDAEGNPVTASTTFTAEAEDQVVTLEFEVDASQLQGQTIVAFEELSSEGVTLVVHADVNDEDQTTYVPSVATKAASEATGEGDLPAYDGQSIVDTVRLTGLVPGQEYTVRGTVHLRGASDDGAVTDEGELAKAETTFKAEASEQTVELSFAIDASALQGRDLTCFEELWAGEVKLAEHSDITDDGQTVRVPSVATTAVDASDGDKELAAAEDQVVTDTVELSNLIKGKAYVVTGTLHYQKVTEDGTVTDGGALKDADGNDVTATTSFVAEDTEQTVELSFEVDASALQGETVVAFEELSSDGVRLAAHADITDEGQSVRVPGIATTLTESETGSQEHQLAEGEQVVTLTDTVSYENLTPGETYELSGTLHWRDVAEDGTVTDGGAVTDEAGHELTVTAEVTPEEAAGTAEVTFEVPVPEGGMAGRALVAYEDLTHGDVTVATHADITDEGQTVRFVDIGTTAVDGADGDKVVTAEPSAKVVDTVSYTGLKPGETYELEGELHLVGEDGQDEGVLTGADDKPVTATAELVPESPDGTAEVTFEFDATGLAGKSAVAFEELSRDGVTVAAHADITDEGQTVTFDEPDEEWPNTGQGPAALLAVIAGAGILGGSALYLAISRRRKAGRE